jgi:hypothetical protein
MDTRFSKQMKERMIAVFPDHGWLCLVVDGQEVVARKIARFVSGIGDTSLEDTYWWGSKSCGL